jgi:hypothetical protein
MKFIAISSLVILSGCSMMPFFMEEVEEAVEFEQSAIKHEMVLRENKQA